MRTPEHPVTVFAKKLASSWRDDAIRARTDGDEKKSETLLALAEAVIQRATAFLDEKLTAEEAAIAAGYAASTLIVYASDGNVRNVGGPRQIRLRRGDLKYPGVYFQTYKWDGTRVQPTARK